MPNGKSSQTSRKGEITDLEHHFSHEDIGSQLGNSHRTVSNFLDRVETNVQVCEQTIHRCLREAGIRKMEGSFSLLT
jgi:hypothetical protein